MAGQWKGVLNSPFEMSIALLEDWQNESLPGFGNGGMKHLAPVGNVSIVVSVLYPPLPPLIMRPVCVFETFLLGLSSNENHLGSCLLGRWWLGQGGGAGAPRWEGGGKPPEPSHSSGSKDPNVNWSFHKAISNWQTRPSDMELDQKLRPYQLCFTADIWIRTIDFPGT